MGSEFSAEVSDARELARVFLDAFGREYEKLFLWFLLQHVRQTVQRESEASGMRTSGWKLHHAPYVPTLMEDRDYATAAKLSKHMKRWNSRFFVLRGDFLLDYYESRDDHAHRRRPLGTINLGNVVVNCNAMQAVKERHEKLAAICLLAARDLPSPEKYPELTVELYHPRDGAIYLRFPQKDSYYIWCPILQRVHWLTERISTRDDVHRHAFIGALRRARVMCGLPDSLEFSGAETKVLQDAIADLVDAKIVPKLLPKITYRLWCGHMGLLHVFHAKSEGLLRRLVCEKWHFTQGRTCARRILLEEQFRNVLGDINAFEEPLREEVQRYTSSDTLKFLSQRVEVPLRELADVVAPRLSVIYARVPKLYSSCVSQGKVCYEPQADHMFLASRYNGSEECYNVESELWQMQDMIAAMKGKFNDRVLEWLVVQNTAVRFLHRLVVNGLFTFETLFERNKMQRSWDDMLREVRTLVVADSYTMAQHVLVILLYETALDFFQEEHVQPELVRLKAVMITPLENRLTEELRPFLPSVQEIVADVFLGDLRNMCCDIAKRVFAKVAS